jgi:hypothetical protein
MTKQRYPTRGEVFIAVGREVGNEKNSERLTLLNLKNAHVVIHSHLSFLMGTVDINSKTDKNFK